MHHRNVYECRGVPHIGAPAPAIARGNASADAEKGAQAQVGVSQLGKDPNRIRFAQAQKGLCDGKADCLICAGARTRAVGIVCRCSIPHGTTGVPRLLRGGQRGESASPDQTTFPQPVRGDATAAHDERRHHMHESGPCGVLHLHQLGQVHRFVPFAAALVPATQHTACNNLYSCTLGVFARRQSSPRITQTHITHHHHTATST